MSSTSTPTRAPSVDGHGGAPAGVDPRGPQVAAGLTSAVLAAVLLVAPHPVGVALLALQTAVFALGAVRGVARTPYAWLFRTLVRPRLAAPDHLEDPRPPRFAQGVGLVFAGAALAAYVVGLTVVGQVATGLALVAALLNAVFGLCLGCELYLRVVSIRAARPSRRYSTTEEASDRSTTEEDAGERRYSTTEEATGRSTTEESTAEPLSVVE